MTNYSYQMTWICHLAINWTGTQHAKLMPSPYVLQCASGRGGANTARALTDKPQLKVTVYVGNRLTHMHQMLMTAEEAWHACHHHWCMYVYFINLPQTLWGAKEGWKKAGKTKYVCVCVYMLWPPIFSRNISGCVLICVSIVQGLWHFIKCMHFPVGRYWTLTF